MSRTDSQHLEAQDTDRGAEQGSPDRFVIMRGNIALDLCLNTSAPSDLTGKWERTLGDRLDLGEKSKRMVCDRLDLGMKSQRLERLAADLEERRPGGGRGRCDLQGGGEIVERIGIEVALV